MDEGTFVNVLLLITLTNIAILAISVKLFTEIVKERAMSRRADETLNRR